ncbi:CBS domain-containing protein [Amycolatopsis alkalitolerans]|uniref:CBS domain-containing protein n=1 Tax=Amycolatopsis alkalitolerans TaxID=2547244 RepID=A0A5C4M2C6_9PSEU|nr:CBS domain-containing protein [Amycolatopsis alkalitolerans]TNC24826.1 CBS domain-containing protein [Amycolatopsis alkalitolerans]
MRRLLVRDVMTADVHSVRRTTPFKDVARILAGREITALPVVDDESTVVGVVSEGDLLYKEIPERRWARPLRRARHEAKVAGELMSAPAVTIGPDESIVEAARLMTGRHVKRLPVVDRYGKLQGVVSRSDLIRIFVRDDGELREEIEREVLDRALCVPAGTVSVTVTDGVVSLAGQLERKSLVPVALSLTHQVPGVIDVVSELSYALDDDHLRPTEPSNHGVLHRR